LTKRIPFISVIIPCYNEKRFINNCLESIVLNDYPKEKVEILVIDGMSNDGTREIIKKYSEEYPFVRMIDNPRRIVPTALNIGIRNSQGEIILRMDAHNNFEKDYISKCVKYLQKYNVDNIGGIWITLPGADTVMAKAIALALGHPFGVGNAFYRIGSQEPRFVDTVPFGCYRKEIFERVGLFDEDLIRNQDDEMNHRIIKNGGKILLKPDIVSHYFARDRLSKLAKMMFQYGYFKPLAAKKIGGLVTWRQVIPPMFVTALLLSQFFWGPLILLGIYMAPNLYSSFSLSMGKDKRYLFLLPIVFFVNHISYGAGYLNGLWDFIICGKHNIKILKKVRITR
jgi:glycosyltransferase involved in cell wall biosynthesis